MKLPCGLAQHWAGRDRYLILIDSLDPYGQFEFLKSLWAADPQRCRDLHIVGFIDTAPDNVQRVDAHEGRVTLTLHRGPPVVTVRRMRLAADVVLFGDRAATDPRLLEWLARKASAPGAYLAGPSIEQTRTVLGRLGFLREDQSTEHKADSAALPTGARWQQSSRLVELPTARVGAVARLAIVIGAGLAGSAVAAELAQRGWEVQVFERHGVIAAEASGNPVAAFRPHLSLDDCALSRLSRAGVQALHRSLERHGAYADKLAERTGLIEVADSPADLRRLSVLAQAYSARAGKGLGEVELLDRHAASNKAGAALLSGGLWLREAGWVRPPALCARWLCEDQKGLPWASRIIVRRGVQVDDLRAEGGQWVVRDRDGNELAHAAVVVLANTQTAASLAERAGGLINAPLAVPGSIGRFAIDQLPGVQCALSGAGYLLPPTAGEVIAAANYDGGPHNSNALADLLMDCPNAVVPKFGTRSSVRYATRDHLPVAGEVPVAVSLGSKVDAPLPKIVRLPGLFVLTGYGSRGLVWSALLAQLVAARINGEPDPLDAALIDAVDPARFWRRDRLKRTITA
ncbi:MAG: FAD-dependent oxidoreductase [Betaproteobacteria bacterium]|nr:FAD-dependent oxidoreductase [Betaproteobacteria bacterium]